MKVVILAGGRGTRLAEETVVKPKPMVEIGGQPILWHLMNIYSRFGFREFIIALGYKGEIIKDYFLNYHFLRSDLKIRLHDGHVQVMDTAARRDWAVHLVDTGLETMTGGRMRRLAPWLGKDPFLMTYGDGLS